MLIKKIKAESFNLISIADNKTQRKKNKENSNNYTTLVEFVLGTTKGPGNARYPPTTPTFQ